MLITEAITGIPAFALPAQSEINAKPKVVSTLDSVNLEQTMRSQRVILDQRIARAESLIQQMRVRIHVQPSRSVSLETPSTAEGQIQVLDEVLVEDTALDPFEDPFDEEGPPINIHDPWETFNTTMFSFNVYLDSYLLKPIAIGYDVLLPDPVEEALGRAFNNIRVTPHLLNTALQGKFQQAGIVLGRFLLNSTLGVAGLFDAADHMFHMPPLERENTAQTLGMYGVNSGPYLVLPLLPPTTVRDGAGTIGDLLLDPLTYLLPFLPGVGLRATEVVHDRSQQLEIFQGAQDSTLDLYGAVREAYFQKQAQAIMQ